MGPISQHLIFQGKELRTLDGIKGCLNQYTLLLVSLCFTVLGSISMNLYILGSQIKISQVDS